jgi:tetratricopeptide (TPR) repeat protein
MPFRFVLTLLLMVSFAGTAFTQTVADAAQLADEGRNAEALAAFRQVAARNPNDLDARLWIARLHERMGNLDQAESVYKSVLLEDPTNLEAALGVASALLARNETEDAIELLESVAEREPQNVTALALLGRGYRQAGQAEQAIGYLERAVAAAPTDEHRLRLEDARRSYQHRVEMRGFGEQFSGTTPDSRGGDFAVNYRLSERLRVIGRGQTQRKFSVSEQRGGGGIEWQWRRSTTLRAQLLLGPSNLVMPESDFLGEVDYAYGPAVWTASLRYFDFTGARATFLSPAVAFQASDRTSIALRYALAWTETSTSIGVDIGHTAQLRGAYRLFRRLSLQAAYAAGVDDFETFSVDRIGDFRTNTVSGGVRLDLSTLTTIVASYDRQWRPNIDMGRVNVGIQQRF